MKQLLLILSGILLLTGCWSNQELDDVAIVHGVGLDIQGDKIQGSFEIVRPGGEQDEDQEETSVDSGEHIVLEETSDTLLEGARELINYTKRRLDFGHTESWVINERLAKKNFLQVLDIIRRDNMLRLNGQMFVTKDDPTEILNTPTLYENLVSSELTTSMPQTKFIAEYAPITLREFYKLIEGPVSNAYIPMIYLDENNDQKITTIDGTAVIKENKMVGQLSNTETAGLNLLSNNVKGGSIQVNLTENDKISIEILKLTTKTKPTLQDNKLHVTILTDITGTLADNMTTKEVNENFLQEVETYISEHTKNTIRTTLDKLQHDFKTDITNIGLETYRKYPTQWQHIHSDWNDDLFANASVDIQVQTKVIHKGLINDNILYDNEPNNNPYRFFIR